MELNISANHINAEAARELRTISASNLKEIPEAICKTLTGKGLTFAQAEALLELCKVCLKKAEI